MDDIQDRIAFGQAWNLAVASLSEADKLNLEPETIERRQKYFYDKLTNRKKPEPYVPVKKNWDHKDIHQSDPQRRADIKKEALEPRDLI